MKNYTTELRTAKDIAYETWQKVAHFYDQPINVETKADGSPVTVADKTANRHIIEQLQLAFPNDSIVSEEEATISGGERTWYVDPIDGTKGFIKRNGHFAVQIGLCDSGSPVIGVVYAAALGDMYSGIVGQGAWRDNQRGKLELIISDAKQEKLIASANGDYPEQELASLFEKANVSIFYNCGSEGLRLMKLAENRANLRIFENPNGPSSWDLCGPHAIFVAAGGTLNYIDGSRIIYTQQRKFGKRYAAASTSELMHKIVNAYNKKTGETAIQRLNLKEADMLGLI